MVDFPELEVGWAHYLGEEFKQPYMQQLSRFLDQELANGKTVFPPMEEVFTAFSLTPYDQVKLVVLGQDPYHGRGQAHGLSFSVKAGVPCPPSLKNIYKEIETDYKKAGTPVQMPNLGDLTNWARQGVLLLNSALTTREAEAGAHRNKGWEQFTDQAIKALNDHSQRLVFLLWGRMAGQKQNLIDCARHLVLCAAHPSPLSAHQGFLGCGHFLKANQFLLAHGRKPIDWFNLN